MIIIILAVVAICLGSFILFKGINLKKKEKKLGYNHNTNIVLAGIFLIVGGIVALIAYLSRLLML